MSSTATGPPSSPPPGAAASPTADTRRKFTRPDRRLVLGALLVGLGAGFLSGLFGVGGGILIVPGLVLLLGMASKRASGTSLASLVPISLAGSIGYAAKDRVDWPVALILAAGAVVGAVIGSWLLQKISVRALALVFAALLLATALRLLISVPDATGRGQLSAGLVIGVAALGLGTGILSGMLGVGGGIILVPAMVLLLGMPELIAKGTSLAVIVPSGISGTIANLRRRNVDLTAALLVGVGGAATAPLGGIVAGHLSPSLSHTLFAVLLIVTTARMLWPYRPRRRTA